MLKSDEQAQSADILGAEASSGEGALGAPKPSDGGRLAGPTPSGEGRFAGPKPSGEGRLPSPDRHLAVTPLDLRQAKLGTALRGFNRAQVTTLLGDAAEGYEQALRENERLRQEVARLESSLTQYRDLEGSLKSTLLIAQQTAENVRENAAQESARIIRDAEGRAALMMEKTQARMDDVQRDIDALRMKRREAESNLESLVASIRHTITSVHEQEQREMPKAVGHHLQVVR